MDENSILDNPIGLEVKNIHWSGDFKDKDSVATITTAPKTPRRQFEEQPTPSELQELRREQEMTQDKEIYQ